MKIKIYQPLAIYELGKRANQEDSIFPEEGKATEQDRLFVLCDGMGGHGHGDVASQTIVKTISDYLLQYAKGREILTDDMLVNALLVATDELDKHAKKGSAIQMGTTLTLLYFHANGCTAAHVGDSRIYHLRPAEHTLLYKSRDHSLACDLYEAGELTYEEMKTFPRRNVITRALVAGNLERTKPDIIHISDIRPGDYFYICSDGMLEEMEDEDLLEVFSAEISDEEKRQRLIDETRYNKDNHSAYIIHVKEVEAEEKDESLVNEEPIAKCNALNFDPNKKMKTLTVSSSKVVTVGGPPEQFIPMLNGVVDNMVKKQKEERNRLLLLIVLAVLVVLLVGGFLITKGL